MDSQNEEMGMNQESEETQSPQTSQPPTPPKTQDFKPVEQAEGLFGFIDGLLRHRDALFQQIFRNEDVVNLIRRMLMIIIATCFLTGLVMGASRGFSLQIIASGIKVPVLFLFTLVVCYPVLYIVNVVMGSRLSFLQTFALIMVAVTLNSVLLSSCATIVLFFTMTGASYDFLKLLHVLIFTFSGIWGMIALWRGLQAMCEESSIYPKHALKIMRLWILIFAFVGTQMAWSLRPFVGSPGMEFSVFRSQEGNFYKDVWDSVSNFGTKKDQG